MIRVLFVVTSHSKLGDTGKATGLWFEELATPYFLLRDAGAEITLASIAGGAVPIAPGSEGEAGKRPAAVERFLNDPQAVQALHDTPPVHAFDMHSFDALFLPGGHGTMWDLPASDALATLVGRAFDAGKIIAALCHGPAGLVSAVRADGQPVVKDRHVASFTDAEEEAVGLAAAVPFLLESRLTELGATVSKVSNFAPYAVRDANLITGQNPASSEGVARLVLEALGRSAKETALDPDREATTT